MKPSNALHFYRVRLRSRRLQEILAVIGIGAGVALLFASQVSSSSLTSSVTQLSRAVAGKATLQLLARDPEGFPASTVAEVRRIPGVRVAAPLLETSANAIGPRGSASVELIGAEQKLYALGGVLVKHTTLAPFGGIGAVVLPAPLARSIGVRKFGQEVTFQLDGRSAQAPLYEQLHEKQIGSLVGVPVAIVPLFFAQEMTGLAGRVTRILVQPAPGAEARVRAGLLAIAAGRLNVESLSYDERLFSAAAAANNQSAVLFSVISALVGFLFAFNAMLFAAPQRRRLIADLRREGYSAPAVLAVILLDALVLGVVATLFGLVLGEELSIHVLHSNPAFLSLGFTLGAERSVNWQAVAIAASGGMLAAGVAVLAPLRDLLAREQPTAMGSSEGAGASARTTGGLQALAGLACLAGATAVLILAPRATVPGMVLLVAALLLELPGALSLALAFLKRLAGMITSPIPHVAVMELTASRTRALAVAATGAIAVFGGVAIQGAHHDLLAGLENAARDTNAFTDLWVSPAGSYNLFNTTPFVARDQAKLAGIPGVRAVRLYRGGLLDYGDRRMLAIAPPREATPLLASDQLVQGGAAQVNERLRAGGWVVLSQAVAQEHHLHIGQSVSLPTPGPGVFRLAGLSTNVGWAPGTIVMNASDFARAWASQDATAYNILLTPGYSPARAARAIAAALGPHSALAVQSAEAHTSRQIALSRQALSRLTQIATLILIASVLAMAAAMGALIWQRRPRLAKLKLDGLPRVELWRTMVLESLLLLGVGCLIGAVFGLYGQQLADHALANIVNFPVVYSFTALTAVKTVAIVTLSATAILAVPGYLAASVPATLALQE